MNTPRGRGAGKGDGEVKGYRAFRYRIYPSPAQAERLLAWESSLRFLWNVAHEQRLMGLNRSEKRYPTAFDQMRELTQLRAELPWLADVPRDACERELVRLDEAWKRCFSRAAMRPRWKKRLVSRPSVEMHHPLDWRTGNGILHFPKLGGVPIREHRVTVGSQKRITITRDGDQWFASILCALEAETPAQRHGPDVALDRGVANTIADSDARLVSNPKHLESTQRRLARAQHAVSRRKKGSKNREKAKARVAVLHRKVRRQREHFLHNLSAAYAKSHGTVVVEDLKIGNMVKANSGLARSIYGAGWGELVRQLRYKLEWSGGRLVEVPAAYSSQTCAVCGCVDGKSRKSQSAFECTGCGHADHADVNAAKVLLQRFRTPGNPWCLPVEGSAPKAARRNRKRSGVGNHSVERSL